MILKNYDLMCITHIVQRKIKHKVLLSMEKRILNRLHTTTQPSAKYLRLTIDGNVEQIIFSSQIGAYVDNTDVLNNYAHVNSYPELDTTPQNYQLIKDPINRKPEDELFLREFGEEQKFPLEYSIIGWYKCIKGTSVNQWLNLNRMLQKKEPTNKLILLQTILCLSWILKK
ncbi:unnamed protein product [Paramecium sonneborni]|uniref:Uncharacterized protein n=1 Tax=Paramecium sonneborni TaxID=65129 RepID=A0A8S1KCH4_9CILI|nr:unnamed protein product [Paramecium sonneborni]